MIIPFIATGHIPNATLIYDKYNTNILVKTHTKNLVFSTCSLKFILSRFPTSCLAPSRSGTSQGWRDQLQALIQRKNIIYNKRGGRGEGCFHFFHSGEEISRVLHSSCKSPKEHGTRKGGNRKIDFIPYQTQSWELKLTLSKILMLNWDETWEVT